MTTHAKYPQFTLIKDSAEGIVIRHNGLCFGYSDTSAYRDTYGVLDLDKFLNDFGEEIIESYEVMTCAGE